MNVASEIQKLIDLHRSGALSDAEFEAAKAILLQPSAPPPLPPESTPPPVPAPASAPLSMYAPPAASVASQGQEMEHTTRQWAMFLHLSQLAGFLVPLGGLVAPIIIWQVKKKDLPGLDIHGVHAVNWVITEVILGLVCVPLCFILIGIPLLLALAVVGVIFPIIAGVKANNGEVWRYPMSFSFIKHRPSQAESAWPGR